MFSLEELFYRVDNFCQAFEPRWQQQLLTYKLQTRQRARQLCLSEIMTILIAFHQQGYRTFKDYYLKHVCCYWKAAFPGLVSKRALCQLDALSPVAAVCLFTLLFWRM